MDYCNPSIKLQEIYMKENVSYKTVGLALKINILENYPHFSLFSNSICDKSTSDNLEKQSIS